MARIGTRKLTLAVDDVEYAAEVSKSVITSNPADAGFTSFAAAAAGGSRDYALNLVMTQDAAASSLWSTIWSAAGSEVEVIVRPYGNEDPTVGEPHYSGTVVVKEPDGDFLGGEADVSTTAAMTVEVSWPFTAKPTKITA